jgi:ABC-type multidrug transport system fused ATPase/permease subunit
MKQKIKENPFLVAALVYMLTLSIVMFILKNDINNAFDKIDTEVEQRSIAVEQARQERLQQILASNIKSCQGQNQVRALLRQRSRREIEDSKEVNPNLFPDIPKEKFQRLVQKDIRHEKNNIEKASKVSCKQRYEIKKFE